MRARLPQRVHLVGDIHRDLVLVFLTSELRLAELQLIDAVVALRLAVSDGERKIHARHGIREIAAEDLSEGVAPTTLKIRKGSAAAGLGRAGDASVVRIGVRVQTRQEGIGGSRQVDLVCLVAEM